jgi:hypothetical protein
VAAIHHLEKRDLWVAGQVYVLGTVRYKLHKSSTSHLFLYLVNTK